MAGFYDAERETPTYGAAFNTDEIVRRSRDSGSHFFDADTLRFFGSRVLDGTYGGRLFVTSERTGFDHDSPRGYTVREAMPDGSIADVGGFNAYTSSAQARRAARAAAKDRHVYYFDGRHGRAGRRRCYVITANDPWAALDRLHSNFRIYHCGRATQDYMLTPTNAHYVRLEA